MLCFSIGLFLRLRCGKKQEKTAKFSYSEEESNFDGEYTTEEPDAETVKRKSELPEFQKTRSPIA
jgi:hypothetical protein